MTSVRTVAGRALRVLLEVNTGVAMALALLGAKIVKRRSMPLYTALLVAAVLFPPVGAFLLSCLLTYVLMKPRPGDGT